MPERGSGDGPDYGWLYGKKGEPAPEWFRGPRAHPGDAEDRPPDRGSAPPAGPAGAPYPSSRHSPWRLPRSHRRPARGPEDRAARAGRSAGARSSCSCSWPGSSTSSPCPLWAWSNIEKVDADPAGARPAEQPGTTYLLVGSDSRKGLSAAENKRLGTGGVGDVGQRTDTIMLLHTGDGPSLLLSIPRDSLVDIPGRGTTKINSAFAIGGPRLLVGRSSRTPACASTTTSRSASAAS